MSAGGLPTRRALNLAELIERGLVAVSDVRLADASALLTVETELLEQLQAQEAAGGEPAEVRRRLLGYAVEPGTGDLHDFAERRLVTEYLLATGVDALLTPIGRQAPRYSHVARDATLVAIPGDIAPEAIVQRLTSCPRVLLYGLDATGTELRGTLFRRVADVTSPAWPERARLLREGRSVAAPSDLYALLEALEQAAEGTAELPPAAPSAPPDGEAPPRTQRRRRPRHIPLKGPR
jgi:hypothetical protein